MDTALNVGKCDQGGFQKNKHNGKDDWKGQILKIKK
jgi:hypothetical protein